MISAVIVSNLEKVFFPRYLGVHLSVRSEKSSLASPASISGVKIDDGL